MENKTVWILATDTLCQGEIIGCWTEENGKDVPCTFESEEACWKEIADDMIAMLQQFKDGERSIEDTDFSPSEYPLEVDVDEDGVFYGENEVVLFDPEIGRP
jgi:hypothetical protein